MWGRFCAITFNFQSGKRAYMADQTWIIGSSQLPQKKALLKQTEDSGKEKANALCGRWRDPQSAVYRKLADPHSPLFSPPCILATLWSPAGCFNCCGLRVNCWASSDQPKAQDYFSWQGLVWDRDFSVSILGWRSKNEKLASLLNSWGRQRIRHMMTFHRGAVFQLRRTYNTDKVTVHTNTSTQIQIDDQSHEGRVTAETYTGRPTNNQDCFSY